MQIKMQDANTLIVEPESTAEQVYLEGLVKRGVLVTLEKPQPFAMNVIRLKIEASPAERRPIDCDPGGS